MNPYYEHAGITIYHGDCRGFSSEIPSETVLISDPPYGVSVSLGVSSKGSKGGMWKGVRLAGDNSAEVRDEVLDKFNGLPFAVFGSHKVHPPERTQVTLVWEKGEHVGAGDLSMPWKPNFELIFIHGTGAWRGERKGSVVKFNAVAGCVGNANTGHRNHPTEKPERLMSYLIQRSIARTVFDPFMGSGTTLVSAKSLGLSAIGIEIEERYCEIAARRLSQEVFDFK